MKTITSRINPIIKQIVQLHTLEGRWEYKQFLAQGFRVCQTILQSKIPLVQIYVTQEKLTQAQELTNDENITIVNESVIEKISPLTNASGMVGVFSIMTTQKSELLQPGIVLAHIQDPGNMGTLIRTAAALAIKNVIIIGSVDVWNPKVVQASVGTLGFVDIIDTSWPKLLQRKKDLKLCALVVENGKKPKDIPSKQLLLVIGSEAHGIPQEWYKDMDYFMTIPMTGTVESLNAAVAGSIAMYATFNPDL